MLFSEINPDQSNSLRFVGYFYTSNDTNTNTPLYNFEEILARLATIGEANGQDIFLVNNNNENEYKHATFELKGYYDGRPFCLYDYKGSESIHISTNIKIRKHRKILLIDIKAFCSGLLALINLTQPKVFSVVASYTKETYQYPPARDNIHDIRVGQQDLLWHLQGDLIHLQ